MIQHSIEEVPAEVKQIEHQLKPPTYRESVTTPQTNIDTTYVIEASANVKLRALAVDGVYAMRKPFDDGPYDVV